MFDWRAVQRKIFKILNQPHWQLLLLVLTLIAILFWPVRYPSVVIEENSENNQTVVVQANQPLQQRVKPAHKYFSGVVFWTREPSAVHVPPDSPIKLEVATASGEVVRTIETTMAEVYQPIARELRFTFAPIRSSQQMEYVVSLATPTLVDKQVVPLRKPNDGIEGIAVAHELLATRPLIRVLLQELLNINTEGQDIYYYWHRGGQIVSGENPYECSLDNTCINRKNPGHFPLFYWLSALSQKMGLEEFEEWIAFWRIIFIGVWAGIGALIFATLYRRQQSVLALFGLLFWLFNRWSLYVIRVGQIDFLAIFCLVASLLLFKKHRFLSLILFSTSLAFKQVAVFLVPLYLVMLWRRQPRSRWLILLLEIFLIGSVPLLVSIPFLLDNPQAMITGLMFSVNRTSEADLGAPVLSRIIHWQGKTGVIFMGLLMGLIYILAWRRRISMSMGALLIYLTFVCFNATIFNQYFPWFLVLAPLAASDFLQLYPGRTEEKIA